MAKNKSDNGSGGSTSKRSGYQPNGGGYRPNSTTKGGKGNPTPPDGGSGESKSQK